MKKVIVTCGLRILIASILCGAFSKFLLGSDYMVELGNQIALGQLEGSEHNYDVLQLYNTFKHCVLALEVVVATVCGFSVVRDIVAYIKHKKG